jgi:acyl carrier protein
MNSIEERITTILSGQFRIDPSTIDPDATFEALSIDSLIIVEVGLVLEEEFGIVIEDGELHDVMTISEAADLIAVKKTMAF